MGNAEHMGTFFAATKPFGRPLLFLPPLRNESLGRILGGRSGLGPDRSGGRPLRRCLRRIRQGIGCVVPGRQFVPYDRRACFEGDKWHHVTVRCSDKDEKDMRMWARGLIPYEKARKKFGFRYPGLPHTYYGMRPEYGNGKF